MKKLFILMLSFTFATVGYAQETTKEKLEAYYQGIHKTMVKRAYTGQYELPKLPKATPELMRKAHDATGAPLNFKDRIWSPGEWEEVKAIVVSPLYSYLNPGYLLDPHYYASPLVPGYATYYYKQNPDDPYEEAKIVGYGQYVSLLDVQTDYGLIFLQIMDAIQRGGAEAWVRIDTSNDAYVIRNAMKDLGMVTDNMRFFVAPGNDYWLRDCGPICFYYGDDDNLAMLDFFYSGTRYADDALPSVLHREMGIPNYISSIVWEGGNCLVDGVGTLVTSESAMAHNDTDSGPIVWDGENYSTVSYTTRTVPTNEEIAQSLQETLGQNKLLIIPALKSDGGTGHVDLYADAKDENGFLFTKMPEQYNTWKDYATVESNIAAVLGQNSFWDRNYYNMGELPFPSKNDGSDFESEEEYGGKYSRSYANHCIVNNVIIQPCFSPVDENHLPTAEWDRKNIEILQNRYPGYTFYCIDMRKFDGQGGSIHCVTKQIPADNPVRIIHKNIHGSVNAGTLTDIPFRAVITNKSGIANAQLVYRVNNGEWQVVDLNNNDNSWYASVPTSTFTLGSQVDYYFSATSNNGKTITKPLNASYGAFYNFSLTNEGTYDEKMFDFDTNPVAKENITFVLGTTFLREDTSGSPATAISEVNTDNVKKADNCWYTISGSRLSVRPSAKGIYIYNGKKVAIK